MKKKQQKAQGELVFYGPDRQSLPVQDESWPDQSRFPVNLREANVRSMVLPDLRQSVSPLIVTGYASLGTLIDFVDACDASDEIRVLLGHEPFASNRNSYGTRKQTFSDEITEYWSARGVSLSLSAKVVGAIERVKAGVLRVRVAESSQRLHAKIYRGDEAVTLGSSNFTGQGMQGQMEANVRFEKVTDRQRFDESTRIAENYWQLGVDYEEEFMQLLEHLLQVVDWEEGLGKACAELLEGEWAKPLFGDEYFGGAALWPSQSQGIAQALYILSNQGSVLIADATGSGKTKLGVHLVSAIQQQILRSNRLRRGKPILICPPLVKGNWDREIAQSNLSMSAVSHGD